MLMKLSGLKLLRKAKKELGMVAHIYNPNTEEAETRGSRVQGQPGLQNQILPQEVKKQGSKEGRKGGREGGGF
jgi:hypothetical protein